MIEIQGANSDMIANNLEPRVATAALQHFWHMATRYYGNDGKPLKWLMPVYVSHKINL